MPLFRKLATLATAAEAARRYAKKNPDKAGKMLDQAAAFVDKQTKGKYKGQIDGAARKVKGVAGIQTSGPGSAGNGYTQGYEQNAGFGKTEGYTTPLRQPGQAQSGQPQSGQPQPGQPQPGQPYPGSPER